MMPVILFSKFESGIPWTRLQGQSLWWAWVHHARIVFASTQHAQTGQHVYTIHGLTEPRAQSSMLTTSEEEDENRDGRGFNTLRRSSSRIASFDSTSRNGVVLMCDRVTSISRVIHKHASTCITRSVFALPRQRSARVSEASDAPNRSARPPHR